MREHNNILAVSDLSNTDHLQLTLNAELRVLGIVCAGVTRAMTR